MAIKAKTPKIRTQFLAVMILLTVAISGIFTFYTYTSMKSEMMHSIDRQLLTAADMAHAMLPPNYHDRITNPDSVSAADYLAIVDEYNQLCTDLGLEYLWSLLLIDGQVVFTSATSPDKIALNYKQADFFEVHTNPELYLPTFTKMTPTFQNSDDKWGRIRVALIPYEDQKGRPYLFGASVRLNYVDGILHKMLVQCLIFGMLLILIALSASFVLSYYIARPMQKLNRTIKAITDGESGLIAEEEGAYEQNQIAISFNEMNRRLQEKIAELDEQGKKYRMIAENTSDVISVYNIRQERFTYVSPSVVNLTGFTPEETIERGFEGAMNLDSIAVVGEMIKSRVQDFMNQPELPNQHLTEIQQPCKNGSQIWVEVASKYYMNSQGEIEAVSVSRSIENRKKTEEKVVYLSYHDHLTGLYNRRFYEEELRRLDTERNLPIALIMADVNGLKLTNDAFGHEFGDRLLQKIADVLREECRADEILARIGGDEFIIILPKTDSEKANKMMVRIEEALARVEVNHTMLSLSMGCGIKLSSETAIAEIFKIAEDKMYSNKITQSSSLRGRAINMILDSLYEKSERENQHSKGVAEICEAIAITMGMSFDEANKVRMAGLMHDIGKIALDNAILDKTIKLDEDEWVEIKRHPEVGYRILNSVSEFLEIAGYVLSHHERWDGSGYPRGLKQEEICIESRIIAVADAYDAMRSNRAYRSALNEEEAINEIKAGAGQQFDPDVARIFIEKVLGKTWL